MDVSAPCSYSGGVGNGSAVCTPDPRVAVCRHRPHEWVARNAPAGICIWYRCLMNGSNHLGEADARPLHLCPVDLRKLNGKHQIDW